MACIRSRAPLSIFLVLGLLVFGPPNEASAQEKPAALILKVEGTGQAFVRRKNRQLVSAAIKLSVFPGDSISTDNNSAVELLFPEGSIVRVGLNSQYKIAAAEQKDGFVAWIFELGKGSLRALIEKSGDKKNVRVRIDTPAGSMGVRGTEFLLEHDEKSGITRLYTLHGLVEFGAHSCFSERNCSEVAAQKMSMIKKGDKFSSDPRDFGAQELLQNAEKEAGTTAGSAEHTEFVRKRLALLMGLKKVDRMENQLELLDRERLEKIIKEAEDQLQAAQDFFMGRDEELRQEMHAAKEAGTFDEHMKLADTFIQKAGTKALDDSGATGIRETRKFALAKAVMKSEVISGRTEATETNARTTVIKGRLKKATPSQGARAQNISSERLVQATKALTEAKASIIKQREKEAEESLLKIEQMEKKKDCPECDLKIAVFLDAPESICKRGDYGDLCKNLADSAERERVMADTATARDKHPSEEDKVRPEEPYVPAGLTREGDRCYRLKTVCEDSQQKCDLRSGKKCEPQKAKGACKSVKAYQACPSPRSKAHDSATSGR